VAETTKIRIGLDGARELELEADDAEALRKTLLAGIDSDDAVVWVRDAKGNEYGLVTAKLAFVEIEGSESRSGVGFNLVE